MQRYSSVIILIGFVILLLAPLTCRVKAQEVEQADHVTLIVVDDVLRMDAAWIHWLNHDLTAEEIEAGYISGPIETPNGVVACAYWARTYNDNGRHVGWHCAILVQSSILMLTKLIDIIFRGGAWTLSP